MRSKYFLAVIGLLLPMALTVATVKNVSSSPSIEHAQTSVVRAVNPAPIARTFKRAQRHQNIRLACFAGVGDECSYDSDCCSGNCNYYLGGKSCGW